MPRALGLGAPKWETEKKIKHFWEKHDKIDVDCQAKLFQLLIRILNVVVFIGKFIDYDFFSVHFHHFLYFILFRSGYMSRKFH